jgi:hypothetical protein
MSAEIADDLEPVLYVYGDRSIPPVQIAPSIGPEIGIAAEDLDGRGLLRQGRGG